MLSKSPIYKEGSGGGAAHKVKRRRRKVQVDSKGTPSLFVDDRAGSKDLMEHTPFTEVGELCHLASGDVCFGGNGPDGNLLIGVEVKSILDLVSSMNTGRLQATQLPAMLDHYHVSWLCYYGQTRIGSHGQLELLRGDRWEAHYIGKRAVPYGFLEQFLMSCTAVGVHVKQTHDVAETAAWIGCLARWWSKEWTAHKSLRTFDQSRQIKGTMMPTEREDVVQRAKIAAQLPGIGYDRAMSVAKHFTSIVEMVLATDKEWQQVPGIGKGIARVVTDAMQEIHPRPKTTAVR